MPALSIITINLNNRAGLIRTLQSVISQTFPDFEYIVIDGNSTDGSQQAIQDYADMIRHQVSEPDRGIYHAMNKGIQLAQGEYCLFLNSGDWLVGADTLKNMFSAAPSADIVSGDVYFYDNQKDEIKWHVPSPDQVTAATLFLGSLPHQATLIRRSLFDKIGLYNEQMKIVSDWLFFIEALLIHHCTYQHHRAPIAYFSMDGISCNPETEPLRRQEQSDILAQRYPMFLPDYERMDLLEKQSQQWLGSPEYKVYKSLEKTGIIKLGTLARRVWRVISRKMRSTTTL
nr:glycosyltransferase family 2 protein [uncultured Dyadobacter sp.]